MEKLVVKTAVKTVLIILGIFVAVFAIFNFAFPQHMASATESLGNYDLAVKYASLRYYYTKDVDDLARCFDDSVLLGNDEYILEYGQNLVEHKEYDEVCKRKNAQYGGGFDYDYRVSSKLAISLYNTGKTEEGINYAVKAMKDKDGNITSFPYGNPLISLAARISSDNSKAAANIMLLVLKDVQGSSSEEETYLVQVTATMNRVAATGV